jgi:hypothetical protein
MNLSWLLAAHLKGWAPLSILDAYEAERWPITSQVSRFAMSHAEAEIRRRGSVPEEIEDAGPTGGRVREEIGRLTYEINVRQYACAGLNFGTYYDRSPIIAYDGGKPPPYTMDSYTPSTVPGCRTPHLWCKDGRSLYDAMGPEFTLLRIDPLIDVTPLGAAARARGARTLVDLDTPTADALELLKLIDEEPTISILVLGAATGPRGPGPLVSALTSKFVGKLRVPVTIVPGHLSMEDVDTIA